MADETPCVNDAVTAAWIDVTMACVIARVFYRPRAGRRLSRLSPGTFLAPRNAEGMERQVARPYSSCRILFWRMRAPLGAPSRRLTGPGPRFRILAVGVSCFCASKTGPAAFRQRAPRGRSWCLRAGSAAARELGVRFPPCPRAPRHRNRFPGRGPEGSDACSPAPFPSRGSIFGTSREDALGRARRREYKHRLIVRSRGLFEGEVYGQAA